MEVEVRGRGAIRGREEEVGMAVVGVGGRGGGGRFVLDSWCVDMLSEVACTLIAEHSVYI